jgi:hypothetical protein
MKEHERDSVLQSQPLNEVGLDRSFAASTHSEVFSADGHVSSLDLTEAGDVRIRKEHPLPPSRNMAGKLADLREAARVDQLVNALSDGETSGAVLTGDAFWAAEASGDLAAPTQLLELGFPSHCTALLALQ